MKQSELQAYLQSKIPIAEYMGIQVSRLETGLCELKAPLAPNQNDKGIAFGGSLASLATLSAWGVVFQEWSDRGWPGDIVIRKSETFYLKPGLGEMIAIGQSEPHFDWQVMENRVMNKGIGRVELSSEVFCGEEKVLKLTGEFVCTTKLKKS